MSKLFKKRMAKVSLLSEMEKIDEARLQLLAIVEYAINGGDLTKPIKTSDLNQKPKVQGQLIGGFLYLTTSKSPAPEALVEATKEEAKEDIDAQEHACDPNRS